MKQITKKLNCRFCSASLNQNFLDLGSSPISNTYPIEAELNSMEPFYPLKVYVCEKCLLVQLPEHQTPRELFGTDYAYFSSYSDTWLAHAEKYAKEMVRRFSLNPESQVIEVASNDGYLLKYFKKLGIKVLGIDPAANVAKAAQDAGIETMVKFFGTKTAEEIVGLGLRADLVAGNNVLAHVPDINDFVRGLKMILKPQGVITMEFPHLARLIEENQFDTIYHEHFSYFSFLVVQKIFKAHGLTVFDVEELSTHGGSLRIFAAHSENKKFAVGPNVEELLKKERTADFDKLETYQDFQKKVDETKRKLLTFLIDAKNEGKSVAAYGAPAKGNTLLNYCGIREDLVGYTVDRSPHKQNRYLPGTHIPIFAPKKISETKPDYLFILPWNIKEEVMEQMAEVRSWGGKFLVAIPEVKIFP